MISLGYHAYHDVMGSDHRPVTLTVQAQLPRHEFYDLDSKSHQGFLHVKEVTLMGTDFLNMFACKGLKLAETSKVLLCVQFHASYLDLDARICYSDLVTVGAKESKVVIEQGKLPVLHTPLNSANLVKDRSLLMMLWGKSDLDKGDFTLIGQCVYRLD